MQRFLSLALAAVLLTLISGDSQAAPPTRDTPSVDQPAAKVAEGVQAEIPETLAGRRFKQWLEAYNAADAEALRAFHAEAAPAGQAEFRTALDLLSRRDTGGIDLYGVVRSSEYSIVALGFSRLTELWMEGVMDLDPQPPHHVVGVGGRPVAPPGDRGRGKPLSEDDLRAELDRYLEKLTAAGVFSGTVLVAKGGTSLYAKGYGTADARTGARNGVDTKFNLGSMNKMMTAVAIAQLVEQGNVSFDAPIGRYAPGLPDDVAEQVTGHHLLTHTSGLGDCFGPRFDQEKERLRARRDYLRLFIDEPLRFEPGTGWSYSNGGFILLGLIVEQVSGKNYYDYIREHIYTPTGMTSSDSYLRDEPVPNLAVGYTVPLPPDPAELTIDILNAPRADNRTMLPVQGSSAGGGYSTVEDLLKFDQALRSYTLLSRELTETVLTGRVPLPFDGEELYGYGFQEERYNGTRITGHGGGFPGVSAKLDIYRDLGYTVVVLANIDGGAQPVIAKIRELLVRR